MSVGIDAGPLACAVASGFGLWRPFDIEFIGPVEFIGLIFGIFNHSSSPNFLARRV